MTVSMVSGKDFFDSERIQYVELFQSFSAFSRFIAPGVYLKIDVAARPLSLSPASIWSLALNREMHKQ